MKINSVFKKFIKIFGIKLGISLFNFIVLVISWSISNFADAAGTVVNARIINFQIQSGTNARGQDGVFVVILSSAISSSPTCVVPQQNSTFTINPGLDSGKAMISTLLWAFAEGRTISATGTGTCSLWGNTETLAFFATN